MKKRTTIALMSAFAAMTAMTLASCSKDNGGDGPGDGPGTPGMTLTTAKEGKVSFYLRGTGTATVDWGDGSPSETSALASDSEKTFPHTYSGTGSRTVTITGGNVTYLNCSANQLTALDVSKNTGLKELYCYENQLTALDVSGSTGLTYLDCYDNQLTALDVSKSTELIYLYCYDNKLTALDVSKNTGLTELYCDDNKLTALDVSKNTKLTELYCYNNQLTALDVSKNTGLKTLSCRGNQFTAAGLDALFGTLHGNTVDGSKTVNVGGNPGAAGCDATIATAKGWTVVDR
jgi:hypothetical protein